MSSVHHAVVELIPARFAGSYKETASAVNDLQCPQNKWSRLVDRLIANIWPRNHCCFFV